MEPETGAYNRPFLTPEIALVPGYRRLQGIVFRKGDNRFEGRSPAEAIAALTLFGSMRTSMRRKIVSEPAMMMTLAAIPSRRSAER